MTRINHEEGDAETADVANLGEAVGTLSLSPAASEPATIDPSDESFSRGSETSSGPTIRLFIGDLHRSTTEVSRRLHVEALSNNALLWRKTFLLNASYRLRLSINRNMCRRRCRCWRSAWSSRPLGCRRRIKGRQLRGPT
jgi:hypothetical protein